MSVAEKAGSPFELQSGNRTSTRFALGLGEYIGIRMAALRFRLE